MVRGLEAEGSKIFLAIAAKLAGQLSVASEAARRAQSLRIVAS